MNFYKGILSEVCVYFLLRYENKFYSERTFKSLTTKCFCSEAGWEFKFYISVIFSESEILLVFHVLETMIYWRVQSLYFDEPFCITPGYRMFRFIMKP